VPLLLYLRVLCSATTRSDQLIVSWTAQSNTRDPCETVSYANSVLIAETEEPTLSTPPTFILGLVKTYPVKCADKTQKCCFKQKSIRAQIPVPPETYALSPSFDATVRVEGTATVEVCEPVPRGYGNCVQQPSVAVELDLAFDCRIAVKPVTEVVPYEPYCDAGLCTTEVYTTTTAKCGFKPGQARITGSLHAGAAEYDLAKVPKTGNQLFLRRVETVTRTTVPE
jgi:hypothetical protein